MRNIRKIIRADWKGLFTNFFALIIAVGLCLLPALYAWFNIYANWDPYGNTGNIAIAVANLDSGWTDENGISYHLGDEIEEELQEKDSIGWCFVDTQKEAVDGVKAGKYYAALVIDEKFTYSMYHGVFEENQDPKITYYVNDKKNVVATKITDTAVSTLENSINESFIKVLAQNIFADSNELSKTLSEEELIGNFIVELRSLNDKLKDYDEMIGDFMEANELLAEVVDSTDEKIAAGEELIEKGAKELETGQQNLNATKDSFQDFGTNLTGALNQIETSINNISEEIADAQLESDGKVLAKDIDKIAADANVLSERLKKLSESLAAIQTNNNLLSTIDAVKDLQILTGQLAAKSASGADMEDTTKVSASIQKALTDYAETVSKINELFSNQVVPQIDSILANMSDALNTVNQLLDSLSHTSQSMSDVFSGVDMTLGALNTSLSQLKGLIGNTSGKLTEVLEKLENASDSEQYQILLNFLSGDPERMGEYFAEPVLVEQNYIYEIANYGSGVTPFYTVLAVWVGMTILVSLIKVHAGTEGLSHVTPAQLFWGRYFLFFLLSQIQTAIIVMGDLYLLKVQCLHPVGFWVAAAVTSLTFSLFVYSVTISFGDFGKAFAVVVMVIQIAGSGGTYPIEALPSFFRNVYIFFPFPYGINAMRECIGGMYENDYMINLMKLGIFCVASLVIGLVIRIPFMKMNHYFEQRMEDTKMM